MNAPTAISPHGKSYQDFSIRNNVVGKHSMRISTWRVLTGVIAAELTDTIASSYLSRKDIKKKPSL
jgi:hypothetical protein